MGSDAGQTVCKEGRQVMIIALTPDQNDLLARVLTDDSLESEKRVLWICWDSNRSHIHVTVQSIDSCILALVDEMTTATAWSERNTLAAIIRSLVMAKS